MSDRFINVDDMFAKLIGFTSDIFSSGSYLTLVDNSIWCSMIIVHEKKQNQGHFKHFIFELIKKYKIIIPTPLGKMEACVRKWEFIPSVYLIKDSDDESLDECEIWTKEKEG